MSKKYKGRATVQKHAARPAADKRVKTNDSYSNALPRLGVDQPNLMSTAEYPITRLTQNYALLNSLYRNDWIANKIIDCVAEDMTKNWYELTSQLAPDAKALFQKAERKTGVRKAMLEGLKWGRLFGGAAGVIVVSGQEDMLDQPLDLRMVMPDSFKGIIIADRWNGVYPDSQLVQDMSDPDFGTPMYYNFCMSETDMENGIKVHHSRVLRFTGRELPYVERMTEMWWGMSELEHVYNELNKRNTTSENVANLIFSANIKTYKMSDLGELLASTTPELQRQLWHTLSMQNQIMNSMGMNVMDKEDDFQTNNYTFAGLSDIYNDFMQDISGAAEIPATRLFGRAPAGMNATGESDLINYYDKIAQLQESQLRPVLEKLLPILCMSVFGKVPDDIEVEFNPVSETSEEERANLIQQSSSAILSVFQGGLISQRTALKELRQSGVTYNMWTNITDEDIEAADPEVSGGETEGAMGDMAEMGDMGDMMSENPEGEEPKQGEDASQAAQIAPQAVLEQEQWNHKGMKNDEPEAEQSYTENPVPNKGKRRAADRRWWKRNR